MTPRVVVVTDPDARLLETPALDAWRAAIAAGLRAPDTRDALWQAAALEAEAERHAWDVAYNRGQEMEMLRRGWLDRAADFDLYAADAQRAMDAALEEARALVRRATMTLHRTHRTHRTTPEAA